MGCTNEARASLRLSIGCIAIIASTSDLCKHAKARATGDTSSKVELELSELLLTSVRRPRAAPGQSADRCAKLTDFRSGISRSFQAPFFDEPAGRALPAARVLGADLRRRRMRRWPRSRDAHGAWKRSYVRRREAYLRAAARRRWTPSGASEIPSASVNDKR